MNEKRLEVKKFQKLAKVLQVILRIANWVLIVGAVVLIIGLIVINLIPVQLFDNFLSIDANPFIYQYGDLIFHVESTNQIVTGANIKYLFNVMLFGGSIASILALVNIKFIREILKNVIEKNPFAPSCIKSMNSLGIMVIIGGIIGQNLMSFMDYAGFKALHLSQYLSDNVEISFQFQLFDGVTVFVGLGIILFAYIFKYASYLQEEVDATI